MVDRLKTAICNVVCVTRYLEAKRSESGVEVTMTHIAAKAAAVAINDFKGMKG